MNKKRSVYYSQKSKILRILLFSAVVLIADVFLFAVTCSAQWQIATPKQVQNIAGNVGQFIDFPLVQLPAGMQFSVKSSGSIRTQFPKATDFADAHYYVNVIPFPSGTVVKVGLQVKYNSTSFDFLQARSSSAYAGSHNYQDILTSQGGSLGFRFFDTEEPPGSKPYYADNDGTIAVEVAQQTPLVALKDSLLDFGDVDFCSTVDKLDSIEVYGLGAFKVDQISITGSTDFTVASSHSTNGYSLSEPNGDSTDKITVTFRPTKLGTETAVLHILSQGAFLPADQDRRIFLTGVGHGPVIQTVLDTTHFGFVKVGATKQLNVLIKNTGDRDAQLTGLSVDLDPVFSSTDKKALPAGAISNVLFTFAPNTPTYFLGTATITLDNGCQTAIAYMDGTGAVGKPILLPDTIDFGQLVIGDTRTKTGTIKNVGIVGLDIASTTTTNAADFTANGPGAPYSLDTGQKADYAITFSPQAHTPNGLHVGSLILRFVDGQPSKTIVLIGHDHQPITGILKIARNYYASADSVITITQELLTSFDSTLDPVYNFDEVVSYNPDILSLLRVEGGALLPLPDWSVSGPTLTLGEVHIQASSSTTSIRGPGELLRFVFKVAHNAVALDTSELPQASVVFGSGYEPLVTTETGLLRIKDACTPTFVKSGAVGTSVEQNNPNPFNPTTQVVYWVGGPTAVHVTIKLFNSLGQQVATLVDEDKSAGEHSVTVDGSHFPSGVYAYSFDADNIHTIKRMVLSK